MPDAIRSREARLPQETSARGRVLRSALLALVLPPLALGLAGCTRRFFRNRADLEVDSLLAEKSHDPRWDLAGMHVYPNPLARFADCTNPDRPPMPPDDPAAYDLSPNPQKVPHAGIAKVEGTGYMDLLAQWDQENRARVEAERAQERRAAGTGGEPEGPSRAAADQARAEEQVRRELADAVTTERALPEEAAAKLHSRDKPFLVTVDQCVELGLINSREYQLRREELYLSALPVTVERFAFSSQLFFAEQIIRTRAGRQAPGGPANNWTFNTTAGVSKLFSTGALLLLRFANQTVYNLGNNPSTSVSTLSLDFIQPLLRGGGRAVTLEPLTQAERNLLYAIRDFAKFRQEFYVYIASGQATFIPGVQAGVQALTGGTVSQPTPFTPAAAVVVVPTGFIGGGVGPQVTPGEGGRLVPIGQPQAPPRGYLTTLADKWTLINQYRNIEDLTRFVRRFEFYLEGGIVQPVQVEQVRQQRLRAMDTTQAQQATHRNNMDQFKLQLGIPLNVPLELDDGPLRPILDQTRRFEDISSSYDVVSEQVLEYGRPAEVGLLRRRLQRLLTDSPFTRGTASAKRALARWRAWEALPPGPAGKGPLDRKLDDLARERRALMKRAKLPEGRDLPEADRRRLAEIEAELAVGLLESDLRDYEGRPWERFKDPAQRAVEQARRFFVVTRDFQALLEEPFRERTEEARRRWPALPEVCVEGFDLLGAQEDEALAAVTRAALTERLDLMNQRAQLVDSWRKIAVTANALLGTLNVEYALDTTTPANVRQPFNFGGSRTRNRLIINTELPLVRIIERNNYRSALIAYQVQRRNLQSAEDNIIFAVRLDLRQLRELAYNYHTVQKPAVELAYRVVDLALRAFDAPQTPTGPTLPTGLVGPPTTGVGAGGGGGGGDPAALTNQLLMAQNSLLLVGNDLYNTWIGYLTTRMALYRDLGIMPLDPRGVWIDDVARCCNNPAPDARLGRPDRTDRPSGDGRERPQQLPSPRPIATTPGPEAGPGR